MKDTRKHTGRVIGAPHYGYNRRKRHCPKCKHNFITHEVVPGDDIGLDAETPLLAARALMVDAIAIMDAVTRGGATGPVKYFCKIPAKSV